MSSSRRWRALLVSDEAPPEIPGATMAEIERYAIITTMKATGGSTAETARILGLSVRTVQYRLTQYAAQPTQSSDAEHLQSSQLGPGQRSSACRSSVLQSRRPRP